VTVVSKLYARLLALKVEMARFGTVGIVAAVIDIGGFNLLRFGPLSHKVLTAKAISVTAATLFAYFANRNWTWADRDRRSRVSEFSLFVFFNMVGLAIAEACLFISHYGMGLKHGLADNISANVVGLVLGTIFRFWAYRRWVFPSSTTSTSPLPERASVD
jgi:putative flippase GtrA